MRHWTSPTVQRRFATRRERNVTAFTRTKCHRDKHNQNNRTLMKRLLVLYRCWRFSQCPVTIPAILAGCVEKIMSKEVLLDKIKGGWAGQTIGCSRRPTEFDFKA